MSDKTYIIKIELTADQEPYIKLPTELVDQLDWEIDDEIEWEIVEICEDWGTHRGLSLGNISKRMRYAKKEWENATSTDME